jgi:hypothetical protein
MQMIANMRKKPAQPIAFAVERKVDAISVATMQLLKVATLIALARMLLAQILDGTSQAPGPMSTLKKERHTAQARNLRNQNLLHPWRKMVKLIIRSAKIIPTCNTMHSVGGVSVVPPLAMHFLSLSTRTNK